MFHSFILEREKRTFKKKYDTSKECFTDIQWKDEKWTFKKKYDKGKKNVLQLYIGKGEVNIQEEIWHR